MSAVGSANRVCVGNIFPFRTHTWICAFPSTHNTTS